MLREPTTHACLNHGEREGDVSDGRHLPAMIRHRLAARLAGERGFTLIELIVVMILVGILAAIALAVFLNQQDKGKDSSAKSNVTNLARIVQACNAGRDSAEDYRDCDTKDKLGDASLPISTDAPSEAPSGDCGDPASADSVPQNQVRVLEARPDCFVILGTSGSGNRFWFVKHVGGGVSRGCSTEGVNGCPAGGEWAG